jgi:hypothetical protein
MLILGVTADDKGAQLEALIHGVLRAEGYDDVAGNVVGAGGNELDIVATRPHRLVGQMQKTPVIGEAKAYASTVNMPTWQRFLGKLFLAQQENQTTVGVLIALNGVNGNVAGSYRSLQHQHATGIVIIDGSHLIEQAQDTFELGAREMVAAAIGEQFSRAPLDIEPAYYGGIWMWVARWNDKEYSVFDGHGALLPTDRLAALQAALAESVQGDLLATEEAQVRAEREHDHRVQLLDRLFRGLVVYVDESDKVLCELADSSFCVKLDNKINLSPAGGLDAQAATALVHTLTRGRVRVPYLRFVAEHKFDAYALRLVELVPQIQGGLVLPEEDVVTLRGLAPLFPSIWARLAIPIEFIATHADSGNTTPEVASTDLNMFWETMLECVRADFASPPVRGLLFDYLDVAELEIQQHVVVKTKHAKVATITTTARDAIAQLSDELIGNSLNRHGIIRLLPGAEEPWDRPHPQPAGSFAEEEN